MNAIELFDLSKTYQNRVAVDKLSFSLKQGEILALLGANGAGKTTTIKMLSGLTSPSSGDAFIFGKSIQNDMNKIKLEINISPQETAIAPNLTVFENLVFIAQIYGFTKKESEIKANKQLIHFGLEDRKNEKSKKLSGGLKRRLSIAMALITDPKIIFLDEPTLGLDVRARRELWAILRGLKGKITILLTTHYLDEAESLADEIAIINKGKLEVIGTLETLRNITKLDKLEDIFLLLTEEQLES